MKIKIEYEYIGGIQFMGMEAKKWISIAIFFFRFWSLKATDM